MSAEASRQLSAVFAGAAPSQQAQMPQVLTENGRSEEVLLLLTPKKAAADPAA